MPRRKRPRQPLGDRALTRLADPLDELLDEPSTADPASPASPTAPDQPPPPRLRLSTEIDAQVLERAKDVVFWTPGLTLAAFVTEALTREIQRRTEDRGEPYPPRTSHLPPGRGVR